MKNLTDIIKEFQDALADLQALQVPASDPVVSVETTDAAGETETFVPEAPVEPTTENA